MKRNGIRKIKLSNINLISNFEQNLIEDLYQQNKCFNSNPCYVCKRIEESKEDFTKIKRVKDIIKHIKDVKNLRELKRCVKMPVLRYRTYIFFTVHKAYFEYFFKQHKYIYNFYC